MPASDCDDINVLRVGREGFEILGVRRDHGSAGLSGGDDERIDCGAASGKPAKKRGSTGERFGDGRHNIASLEELVLDGVATRVALETLDENDGGDMRWPQSRLAQGQDERQSLLRTFGEASHATGVEDQHLG